MKVVVRCVLMYRHVVMLVVLVLVLVEPLTEIQCAEMMEFHTRRVSSNVDYTNTRTERKCQRTMSFTHREHNFRGIDLLVTVVAIAGPTITNVVFIVPPLRKKSLATLAEFKKNIFFKNLFPSRLVFCELCGSHRKYTTTKNSWSNHY